MSQAVFLLFMSALMIGSAQAELLKLNDNNIATLDLLSSIKNPEKIKRIDLSNNMIEKLSKKELGRFTALSDINLSSNKLTSLDLELFAGCKKLQRINCSANQITTILPSQKGLVNLKILNLSNNQLKAFSAHQSIDYTKLHDLDLSHNQLSDIEQLGLLKKIKYLNLSYNQLKIDDFSQLGLLVKLHNLNLSQNQITEIKKWPILKRLHSLDLSNNTLSDLGDFCHKKNPSLIWIDLSNNAFINSISLMQFTQYESLVHLNLSGNNLIELGFLKKLKKRKCEVITNVDLLQAAAFS